MGLTLKNKPHLSVPRAMACDHNMGIPRLLAIAVGTAVCELKAVGMIV
jgi:hypothetical protein